MARPWITSADSAAVAKVLSSGRIAMGPATEELEHNFAKIHNYRYAVAVSSGGAGITLLAKFHCAAKYEVAGGTFTGVWQAFKNAGVPAIAIDKDESTTQTCIVTALYNSDNQHPSVNSTSIVRFCDWCQAVGTSPPGNLDAVYSFYPNKQVAGGEGGIICTNEIITRQWLVAARNNGRHGKDWSAGQYGGNFRITEMAAALINSQLGRLEAILAERRRRWEIYDETLTGVRRDAPESVFSYVWEAPDDKRRFLMENRFKRAGIEYRRTFPPYGACDRWADYYARTLMLPFWTMQPLSDIEEVCRIVKL